MRRSSAQRARERIALITVLYLAAAILLGWFVPRLRGGLFGINETLGRDQIIAFMSSVSSGMMAFTGIIFSLLFIVLQFGSTAYSPHIVPILASNPTIGHATGIFAGTFIYSLMALRGIGTDLGGTAWITIWTTFVWLLASVYMLFRLVGVFAALTISDVLDILSDMGHREIDRVYGPGSGAGITTAQSAPGATPDRVAQRLVHRGKTAYVNAFDIPELVALASEVGGVIRIPVAIGDSVTPGALLATIEGATRPILEEKLEDAIVVSRDRTAEQGPKHAIRLLADIAIRALSTANRDPTTAVHVLDQLESLLRRLGEADLDVGTVPDASGTVRLVYPATTWDEYLELGLVEIQQYGTDSLQVQRRLAAVFETLGSVLPERRQEAVARLTREHETQVLNGFPDRTARERAERVDRQGLGHPALFHS
jgi:uncharacterized membrane protein